MITGLISFFVVYINRFSCISSITAEQEREIRLAWFRADQRLHNASVQHDLFNASVAASLNTTYPLSDISRNLSDVDQSWTAPKLKDELWVVSVPIDVRVNAFIASLARIETLARDVINGQVVRTFLEIDEPQDREFISTNLLSLISNATDGIATLARNASETFATITRTGNATFAEIDTAMLASWRSIMNLISGPSADLARTVSRRKLIAQKTVEYLRVVNNLSNSTQRDLVGKVSGAEIDAASEINMTTWREQRSIAKSARDKLQGLEEVHRDAAAAARAAIERMSQSLVALPSLSKFNADSHERRVGNLKQAVQQSAEATGLAISRHLRDMQSLREAHERLGDQLLKKLGLISNDRTQGYTEIQNEVTRYETEYRPNFTATMQGKFLNELIPKMNQIPGNIQVILDQINRGFAEIRGKMMSILGPLEKSNSIRARASVKEVWKIVDKLAELFKYRSRILKSTLAVEDRKLKKTLDMFEGNAQFNLNIGSEYQLALCQAAVLVQDFVTVLIDQSFLTLVETRGVARAPLGDIANLTAALDASYTPLSRTIIPRMNATIAEMTEWLVDINSQLKILDPKITALQGFLPQTELPIVVAPVLVSPSLSAPMRSVYDAAGPQALASVDALVASAESNVTAIDAGVKRNLTLLDQDISALPVTEKLRKGDERKDELALVVDNLLNTASSGQQATIGFLTEYRSALVRDFIANFTNQAVRVANESRVAGDGGFVTLSDAWTRNKTLLSAQLAQPIATDFKAKVTQTSNTTASAAAAVRDLMTDVYAANASAIESKLANITSAVDAFALAPLYGQLMTLNTTADTGIAEETQRAAQYMANLYVNLSDSLENLLPQASQVGIDFRRFGSGSEPAVLLELETAFKDLDQVTKDLLV